MGAGAKSKTSGTPSRHRPSLETQHVPILGLGDALSYIAEARKEWRSSQPDLNPERLVFLDETGAKTNMVRLYGRAPRGQRLFSPVPYGHWMTTTFVASLRQEEIPAPCVFEGPMNGASFLTGDVPLSGRR